MKPYGPSNAELEEWVALLEGVLAAKWGILKRDLLKAGKWWDLTGAFCANCCVDGKPDTLAGLHWLEDWVERYREKPPNR